MRNQLLLLSALLGWAVPASLLAAPPVNDSFATPTILEGFPSTASGSNIDATLEDNEPVPELNWYEAQASVWFRWTSPTSGPVQIDTLESDFDTVLAVWTNDALIDLSPISTSDQYGGTDQSAVFIPAVSGATYQIAVYGFYTERGQIALRITNDLLSRISGSVAGPDETTPLQGIQATAHQWDEDGQWWQDVGSYHTDAEGHYAVGGLEAGTYRIRFEDRAGNFLSEVYDNAANLDAGTDVVVAAGETTAGIDASLANASKISGTVTGPDGTTPLEGIQVNAYQWNNDGWWMHMNADWTDSDGSYFINALPAGTYRVEFSDGSGNYLSEAYDDAAELDSGTDVVVAAGETAIGIDASLVVASKISGTVTGPDGTTPLPDIWVVAFHWNDSGWWEQAEWADTDVDGNFLIGGLSAGTYRIRFSDWSGNYAPEIYDDAASLDAGMDVVVVVGATASNIDASLAVASKISGTVTGPDGTTTLPEIWVDAWQWNGSEWEQKQYAETDAEGNYTLGGLAAGNYRIQFTDNQNFSYVSEVYNNAPDLDSGTDIPVATGESIADIDASLTHIHSADMTLVRPTAGNDYEILFLGTPGLGYILQHAATLTSEWSDVGTAATAISGTNVLAIPSTSTNPFWRIRLQQ